MKNIKVITFDGDGTLWDFENAMTTALNKVVKTLKMWFPKKANRISVERLIHIRDNIEKRFENTLKNLAEIRFQSFVEMLKEIEEYSWTKAQTLKSIYFEERYKAVEIYKDTTPTIKKLKKRYIIGLISNGNTYPEKIGMPDLFDFKVYAEKIGVSKPNPEIFQYAITHTGYPASNFLHIGDSPENDIFPALKLRMKAILIKRKPYNEADIPTDIEVIDNLRELLNILY